MDSLTKKSSTGLDENIAGLLCYLVGVFSGLVFFIIEKESRFVRFHALQSLITFGALFVLYIVLAWIPFGGIISMLVGLLQFVLWAFMMYKAYQGEMFKLPIVGDIAEKNAAPSSAI